MVFCPDKDLLGELGRIGACEDGAIGGPVNEVAFRYLLVFEHGVELADESCLSLERRIDKWLT